MDIPCKCVVKFKCMLHCYSMCLCMHNECVMERIHSNNNNINNNRKKRADKTRKTHIHFLQTIKVKFRDGRFSSLSSLLSFSHLHSLSVAMLSFSSDNDAHQSGGSQLRGMYPYYNINMPDAWRRRQKKSKMPFYLYKRSIPGGLSLVCVRFSNTCTRAVASVGTGT